MKNRGSLWRYQDIAPERPELVSFKPCKDSSDNADNVENVSVIRLSLPSWLLVVILKPSQIEWSLIVRTNPDNKIVPSVRDLWSEPGESTGDVSKWPRRSKHHQGTYVTIFVICSTYFHSNYFVLYVFVAQYGVFTIYYVRLVQNRVQSM